MAVPAAGVALGLAVPALVRRAVLQPPAKRRDSEAMVGGGRRDSGTANDSPDASYDEDSAAGVSGDVGLVALAAVEPPSAATTAAGPAPGREDESAAPQADETGEALVATSLALPGRADAIEAGAGNAALVQPGPHRRRRVYYGWIIVVAASIGFAVSTGIGNWGFGAFVRPLESEFGWSRGEVSLGASFSMAAIMLASPFVGMWIDRWGPRSAILFGASLTGIGFASLSQVEQLGQFYALFALTTFFRSWTTYIPLVALVSRWFPEDSGTPMGIVMAGLGFGGVVFAPVSTLLIEAFGWRQAYVLLAIIFSAYFLPMALFVAREPRRPVVAGIRSAVPRTGWLFRDALRTKAFWVLNLAIALLWVSQVGFMAHGQPIFEWLAFTPQAAAVIVGVAALLSAAVRLFAGSIMHHFPSAALFAFVTCAVGSGALAVLLLPVTGVTVLAFLLLWGIGSGASAILVPTFTADTYGQRSIGAFLAFTEVTGGFGTVAGPVVGGVLYDASGSYEPVFVVYLLTFLAAGVFFALFALARHRSRAPSRAVVVVPGVSAA